MPFEEQAAHLRPPPLPQYRPEGSAAVQMKLGGEAPSQGAAVQMEGDGKPTAEQAERIRKMAKMRDDYETEVRALRGEASTMLGAKKSEEQVARNVSARRREIGEKYKDLTPADKREQIYQRNAKKYGDKLGPTPDYLHDKKGKSWADIIESSCTPGGEDIIPKLLAQGLDRPDLESQIRGMRGGGSSSWFDVISEVTKGK